MTTTFKCHHETLFDVNPSCNKLLLLLGTLIKIQSTTGITFAAAATAAVVVVTFVATAAGCGIIVDFNVGW
jgi:hypothetical protein